MPFVPLVIGQDVSSPSPLPVIFLGGQSNMVGWPDQAGDLFRNPAAGLHLPTLLPILQNHNDSLKNKTELLTQAIRKVPHANSNHAVAVREAQELLSIQQEYPSLFDHLTAPLPHVYCSFIWAPSPTNGFMDAVNLSPDAQCGKPWGLELMLGHSSAERPLMIAKVATDGTSIYANWSKSAGNLWDTMQRRIATLKDPIHPVHPACIDSTTTGGCRYEALVWFQGETECSDETNAATYGGNLTQFIRDVQKELCAAGCSVANPDDLPVVIVQVGLCYKRKAYGNIVYQAQADYVRSRKNQQYPVALVRTDDLSSFHHFEVAAHLIIGHRVMMALRDILGMCGDGIVRGIEECEMQIKQKNVTEMTCADMGYHGGILSCNSACRWDTSDCYTCGDGVCREGYEDTSSCPHDCCIPNGQRQTCIGEELCCSDIVRAPITEPPCIGCASVGQRKIALGGRLWFQRVILLIIYQLL